MKSQKMDGLLRFRSNRPIWWEVEIIKHVNRRPWGDPEPLNDNDDMKIGDALAVSSVRSVQSSTPRRVSTFQGTACLPGAWCLPACLLSRQMELFSITQQQSSEITFTSPGCGLWGGPPLCYPGAIARW